MRTRARTHTVGGGGEGWEGRDREGEGDWRVILKNCLMWLWQLAKFVEQAGRLEMQGGVDIVVFNWKARNSGRISMLPCGGKISSSSGKPLNLLLWLFLVKYWSVCIFIVYLLIPFFTLFFSTRNFPSKDYVLFS